MAVNDDVHHVLFHDADVGGGVHRLGGAEQHVGELGAGHGAAPAVGQAVPQRLADQSLRQGGVAHVGHVHGGGDLPVNGPGLDARLMPQLLGVLRRPLQEPLNAEGLAVFHKGHFGDLMGQVVNVLALGLHAPLLGNAQQLLRVLDLVVAALLGLVQGVADLTAMVGVRCRAAGHKAQEIPGHDAMNVAAADAPGAFGCDAAGAHGTDPATGAGLAEAAMGGLVLDPLLPGIGAHLFAVFQQAGGSRFHFLNSD